MTGGPWLDAAAVLETLAAVAKNPRQLDTPPIFEHEGPLLGSAQTLPHHL